MDSDLFQESSCYMIRAVQQNSYQCINRYTVFMQIHSVLLRFFRALIFRALMFSVFSHLFSLSFCNSNAAWYNWVHLIHCQLSMIKSWKLLKTFQSWIFGPQNIYFGNLDSFLTNFITYFQSFSCVLNTQKCFLHQKKTAIQWLLSTI